MKFKRPRYDIAKIKESISPHDFYLREQNIAHFGHRSSGWAVAGTCPFHQDSRPGSFKVNLESGAFKCWSCGIGGGDIISYLQQRDDLTFIETLKQLSHTWSILSC